MDVLASQIKSKVLFNVGTFTNSTNTSSHALFKPTCILRYKLQHSIQINKNTARIVSLAKLCCPSDFK
jgi:hypothetical protein